MKHLVLILLLVVNALPAMSGEPPEGALFWPARLDVDVEGRPQRLRVADLDGDGLPDLAYYERSGPGIWVQLGVAGGTFARPPAILEPVLGVVDFQVADLNGDGHLDLAIATSDSLVVRLGEGTGAFREFPGASVDDLVKIALADMNIDGHIDVVAASEDGVSRLLGDGIGQFTVTGFHPLGFVPYGIQVGCEGDDPWPDVFVHGLQRSAVQVLLQDDGGAATDWVQIPTPYPPLHVALADFDGDGWLDVAISNRWDIDIAPGRGDGSFGDLIHVDTDVDAGRPLVGDLNADGITDLVVVQKTVFTGYPQDEFVTKLGNGDGTFSASVGHYYTGQVPRAVALDDINDDGALDIVVGSAERYVSTFLGVGDGRFHDPGHLPRIVTDTFGTGDFDRDGSPDIVGRLNSVDLGIHLGTGEGTFAEPDTIDIGDVTCIHRIYVRDADGDGHLDLVAPRVQFDETLGFATLIGAGDGSFAEARPTPFEHHLESVSLADMNADGYLDAVVSYRYRGTLYEDETVVLPGAGDGTFGSALWTGEGWFASSTVVDLDGDGHLDLIGGRKGRFLVMRGNGDGTLEQGSVYLLEEQEPLRAEWLNAFAAADLDEDGFLDLVVAGQRTFTAWYGDGAEFVTPEVSHPVRCGNEIAINDINGDGRLDVLIMTDAWNLQVFVAREGRGFDPHPHHYGVSPYPGPFAVFDLDGDGALDVLGTTGYVQGLSILRGTRMAVPGDPPSGVPSVVAVTARNPFRGNAAIGYDLPNTGPVSLNIYDVAGRHVRTLIDEPRALPGTYRVTWDGRSSEARDVAAGVYFVRLETGNSSFARRVVRLR